MDIQNKHYVSQSSWQTDGGKGGSESRSHLSRVTQDRGLGFEFQLPPGPCAEFAQSAASVSTWQWFLLNK